MAATSPSLLFDEITDFLVSSPAPEQIVAFQTSDVLNERLHELLEKNRESSLSAEEQTELNRFLEMGHLMTVLKAKARLKIVGKT